LECRALLSGSGVSGGTIDLTGAFAKFNASATAGKPFVERISVTNDGTGTAAGTLPILVATSPDGTLASGTTLTTIDKKINLKAGKTVKIALTLKAPAEPSSSFLVMELDPANTLGDVNPANNTFSSSSALNVKALPFKKGAIAGQNGWVEDDGASPADSTAEVTTSVAPPVRGNKQTIVINRAVGEDIGVAPSAAITSSAPFTVTTQVEVNYKTTANGPFFGLNLYGNNGATEIGTFGVDATSGDIYDSATGAGFFLLSDGSSGSPAPLTAGTWNTFKIVASFTNGSGGPVTLNYYLNNTLVDTEVTSGVTLNSLNYAYVWSQQGYGSSTDTAGSAAFDDYSVTTTAASTLPQPNGFTFP
jgi:hypothetical protein